jgi:hypothetical protein
MYSDQEGNKSMPYRSENKRNQPTKQEVLEGERAIQEIIHIVEDHCRDHKLSVDILVSSMIAVISRIIGHSAPTDVEQQDKMIEFVTFAVKVSLAENKCRPLTPDLESSIPPWEKN